MSNYFFNFRFDGKKLLVPAPCISDEQKLYNLSNYGNEHGIMQIVIIDGDNEHRIMSNNSMIFAPEELHQTSTTRIEDE